MPTPSKATEARRRLIVALLGAGASRRQAAAVAGIHHSQIARWIERGRRHPGGRFAEFAALVDRAEASRILAAMPDIAEPIPASDLRWALTIAEREWQEDVQLEAQEPVIVNVRFHDGQPIPRFGDRSDW